MWLGCDFARQFCQCVSFLSSWGKLRQDFGKKKAEMFWIEACWIIWLGINNSLFNGKYFYVDEVVFSIKFISWIWLVIGSISSKICGWCNWFYVPSLCL